MKIRRVVIRHYRNLRETELDIPSDAPLICLIGENGSGKTHILELLASTTRMMNIAPGTEMPRGDPFRDPHEIRVEYEITDDPAGFVAAAQQQQSGLLGTFSPEMTERWTGKMTLSSRRISSSERYVAYHADGLGPDETRADEFGRQLLGAMSAETVSRSLFLDADRAYPPVTLQLREFNEAIREPLVSRSVSRGLSGHRASALYSEWVRFLLARESARGNELSHRLRTKRPIDDLPDEIAEYNTALAEVLPYLSLTRVDLQNAVILFSSGGQELPFHELSGGEREVAFLVGQFERFKLSKGLLFVDEPELHLNPNLLRAWLSFVSKATNSGQAWIATHALEAAESTSVAATFVLRTTDVGGCRTASATPLCGLPLFRALSAAVGMPAYSIGRYTFLVVEGENVGVERRRFLELFDNNPTLRVIEGGGFNGVIRHLQTLREIGKGAEDQLIIGGIVDRDFREAEDVAQIVAANAGLLVLPVFEVENLFLQPAALGELLRRQGRSSGEADTLVRDASDESAGLWILQSAVASRRYGDASGDLRNWAGNLEWTDIEPKRTDIADQFVTRHSSLTGAQKTEFHNAIRHAIGRYAAIRSHDTLWCECMGKEAIRHCAKALRLQDPDTLCTMVVQLWRDKVVNVPDQVGAMRAFVDHLREPAHGSARGQSSQPPILSN